VQAHYVSATGQLRVRPLGAEIHEDLGLDCLV
jgi:hypothetical protein